MAKITQIKNAPNLSGSPALTSKPTSLLLNTLYPAEYYVYSDTLLIRVELQYFIVILSVIQNNEILSRIIITNETAPSIQFSNGRFVVSTMGKITEVNYSSAIIIETVTVSTEPEIIKKPTILEVVEEAQKEKRIMFDLPEFELDLSVLDALEL